MTKLNKWLVNDITAQAYKDGKADGRAETIDELLSRLIEMLIKGDVDVEDLRKLAEQLKEQTNEEK